MRLGWDDTKFKGEIMMKIEQGNFSELKVRV